MADTGGMARGRRIWDVHFVRTDAGTTITDPSRWTDANGDTGFTVTVTASVRLQLLTGAVSGRHARIWATQQRQPARSIGVLALIAFNTATSCEWKLALRAQTTTVTAGMPNDGYYVSFTAAGALSIFKSVAGVHTSLASVALGAWTTGTTWIQFECIGTRLRARLWANTGQLPPPPWLIDIRDETVVVEGMSMLHFVTLTAAQRIGFCYQHILYEPEQPPLLMPLPAPQPTMIADEGLSIPPMIVPSYATQRASRW